MRCPKCGATKSSVIDSRQAEEGNTIRRRRECDECQHRFSKCGTYTQWSTIQP